MMKAIFRYNKDLQELTCSKIKPVDFLHCCLATDFNGDTYFAIYVWDSRKVVDSGKCGKGISRLHDLPASKAVDSGKMLVGKCAPYVAAQFDERGFGVKGRECTLVHVFKNANDAVRNVAKYKAVQRVMTAANFAEANPDEYSKTLQ